MLDLGVEIGTNSSDVQNLDVLSSQMTFPWNQKTGALRTQRLFNSFVALHGFTVARSLFLFRRDYQWHQKP